MFVLSVEELDVFIYPALFSTSHKIKNRYRPTSSLYTNSMLKLFLEVLYKVLGIAPDTMPKIDVSLLSTGV